VIFFVFILISYQYPTVYTQAIPYQAVALVPLDFSLIPFRVSVTERVDGNVEASLAWYYDDRVQ
jgi:hypothetical protein